jgi:hypothetical protein
MQDDKTKGVMGTPVVPSRRVWSCPSDVAAAPFRRNTWLANKWKTPALAGIPGHVADKSGTKNKKRPKTLASYGTPEQPSPEVCSHAEYVLAAGL